MGKFKITLRQTTPDFEEKISFFGLRVTRKGQMKEVVIEASDAESAKEAVQSMSGNNQPLLMEAERL